MYTLAKFLIVLLDFD